MKLATRINSYQSKACIDFDVVFKQFAQAGLSHVDLNFPEHTSSYPAVRMKALLARHGLVLNGTALRFPSQFIDGSFTNRCKVTMQSAIELCVQAIEYCRQLGGTTVTIWLAYDGFDYSFQFDYARAFDAVVTAFSKVCDAAPDLRIAIEYKPFQPRAFALIDSMGAAAMVLHACNRENLGITLDYCHLLMKHENPAVAADLFGRDKKLFGVHLNDGYGLSDDGLMVGMASPIQTLEFLFYLKKRAYDGVIYFDTFPQREAASDETAQNIATLSLLQGVIDTIGIDRIQQVIDRGDAVAVAHLVRHMISIRGGNAK